MSALAVALLAVGCAAAGSRWRGLLARPEQEVGYRWALYFAAGAVALYAGLLACAALAVPWRPLTLAGLLIAAAALAHLLSRRQDRAARPLPWRSGWGDVAAVLALGTLTVCAWRLWIVYPDFIFHWGIKGHRFFLAHGIDFAFLARPWNWTTHPAYPNLLPALFAATALTAGAFAEPAMMLWTPFFAVAALVAARQVLRQGGASPFAAATTLAALALALAAFGIGFSLAGSPDWILAAAPLLAWPALLGPRDRAGDLAVGVVAALAAGAKVEGIVLGGLIAAVSLWGRGAERLRALPWTLVPPLAVVVPWALLGLGHGLFGGLSANAFHPHHAGAIFAAIGQALGTRAWHGLPLLLALLPLLWWPKATRPMAAVCSLQLLFYLAIYFYGPYGRAADAAYFVRSNFARLAFHLLPTILVAAGLAGDAWARRVGGRSSAAAA